MKMTQIQRETLEALARGAMLTLDQYNILNLSDALPGRNSPMVTGSVRDFLTRNRLVERLDKTRDLKVKGNGYIISAKGRAALSREGDPI